MSACCSNASSGLTVHTANCKVQNSTLFASRLQNATRSFYLDPACRWSCLQMTTMSWRRHLSSCLSCVSPCPMARHAAPQAVAQMRHARGSPRSWPQQQRFWPLRPCRRARSRAARLVSQLAQYGLWSKGKQIDVLDAQLWIWWRCSLDVWHSSDTAFKEPLDAISKL